MKTQGEKIRELAQNQNYVTQKALEGCGKILAKKGLQQLEYAANLWGTQHYVLIQDKKEYYHHRNFILNEILQHLPIDIGCMLYSESELDCRFTLKFFVADLFEGGRLNYDFPVYRLEKRRTWSNVTHLREIGYDPDAIRVIEILTESEFEFQNYHVDYALKNVVELLAVVDQFQAPKGEYEKRLKRSRYLLEHFFPAGL